MGDGNEILAVKSALGSVPFMFSSVQFFYYFLNTNYVLGSVWICIGVKGTKGAIPGYSRIHSSVRETMSQWLQSAQQMQCQYLQQRSRAGT